MVRSCQTADIRASLVAAAAVKVPTTLPLPPPPTAVAVLRPNELPGGEGWLCAVFEGDKREIVDSRGIKRGDVVNKIA